MKTEDDDVFIVNIRSHFKMNTMYTKVVDVIIPDWGSILWVRALK